MIGLSGINTDRYRIDENRRRIDLIPSHRNCRDRYGRT